MNLSENIISAIQKYGKNGDGSFECYGITFENGRIAEEKVYRYSNSKNNDLIDWNKDINPRIKLFISNCESQGYIKFREISKRTLDDKLKLYFSIKRNIPIEKHEEIVNRFFCEFGLKTNNINLYAVEKCISNHLSPGRSPLFMLGIETDERIVLGLKAHFSLERFEDYSQHIGEKLFFEELKNVVFEICDLLQLPSSYYQLVADIGCICSDYNYYPFLMGINESENSDEYKFYFRVKYNGLSNNEIYTNSLGLVEEIKAYVNTDLLNQVINNYNNYGLFMEGFALGVKNKDTILLKTYYFPLPGVKI